ncbi:MAG: orotate phosphoribosyltransferase-like protein [Methanomicrobiales archaeon]|jgi:orotate phosphoribosyltransferase|nr:orotate phosphoribosyltransferase-like protein [Methanomicrobiales archaeon]
MSSLDELIAKARHLLDEGHSPGQIADELSLSIETVTWLLTQQKGTTIPKDIHIDWTAVSSHVSLLEGLATLLVKRYYLAADGTQKSPRDAGFPAVIVGIALSGIPIATLIASQESSGLAIYYPAKTSLREDPIGSISGNFAQVSGERCIIVDDVITSGTTMREVVRYLRNHQADPVAIWVIFDKRGFRDIEGVPVFSLFTVSRID